MIEKESFICRFCGKIGFIGKKAKGYRGDVYYTNKNERCKICKSKFINDYDFLSWKQKGLTSGKKLNKRLRQIYKLTGRSSNNLGLFFDRDLLDLYRDQDFSKDYSDRFIKKKIKEKKDHYKPPTEEQIKKDKKDQLKNTFLEIGNIFMFFIYLLGIVFFWSLFAINPLAGFFFLLVVGSWYLVIKGDIF